MTKQRLDQIGARLRDVRECYPNKFHVKKGEAQQFLSQVAVELVQEAQEMHDALQALVDDPKAAKAV